MGFCFRRASAQDASRAEGGAGGAGRRIEEGGVSVRSRKDGDMGSRKVEEFISDLLEEIRTKKL